MESRSLRIAGGRSFAVFGLLALSLYWVSIGFVSYSPFGVLQAGLVMLCPFLLLQRSSVVLGVAFLLFSLLLGIALAHVDRQSLWGQRAVLYLYIHLVWLLVLLSYTSLGGGMLFRAVVLVFVFLLGLINTSDIASNQKSIALLEGGVLWVGLSIFGRTMLPGSLLLRWWFGVVAVLCAANLLAIRDGVGLASWWRAVEICGHLILGWSLYVWWRQDRLAAPLVAAGVVLASLVCVSILVGTWLSLDDPQSHDWFYHPPLFRHVRHLGYFLCVGFVVSAWVFLTAPGRFWILAWLVYVLVVSALLWSGGRGAFLAGLAGVISLLLLGGFRQKTWRWSGVVVGLLLSLWLSSLFPVEHPGLGWVSALQRSDGAASFNGLSTGRLDIWRYLWGFIVQRPWFGWGGEGVLAVWDGSLLNQAHNAFLQLLIEWGVTGLVVLGLPLFCGAVVGIFRCCSAPVEFQLRAGFGLVLVVALLLLSMIDGVFYHGLPSAFFALGYVGNLAKWHNADMTIASNRVWC
ncbi:O-antigen ligase [Aquipseudomonas alcaligenes]|uniref:O-antigen ligase family protein n=1 Tax=Aquipseudomonas alcaligenes TaxID=43263 RepID=UPI001659EC1A|nr:O-antigen ligase family protein [Pseudomonas alcaligenes]